MAVQITDQIVDDADAYFSTRLNASAWIGSDETSKKASLVTASNLLNSLGYLGIPVSSAAAFPRYLPGYNGAVIPQMMLWALYEQALHMLANPDVLAEESGVETLVLGPIHLEKIQPVKLMPKIVQRYIAPYTSSNGGFGGGSTWWRNN